MALSAPPRLCANKQEEQGFDKLSPNGKECRL